MSALSSPRLCQLYDSFTQADADQIDIVLVTSSRLLEMVLCPFPGPVKVGQRLAASGYDCSSRPESPHQDFRAPSRIPARASEHLTNFVHFR